jgi:hypothetical protein
MKIGWVSNVMCKYKERRRQAHMLKLVAAELALAETMPLSSCRLYNDLVNTFHLLYNGEDVGNQTLFKIACGIAKQVAEDADVSAVCQSVKYSEDVLVKITSKIVDSIQQAGVCETVAQYKNVKVDLSTFVEGCVRRIVANNYRTSATRCTHRCNETTNYHRKIGEKYNYVYG